MRRELRDKWVKALRSGEYKQGRLRLRDIKTNSYCCLGVLCMVDKAEIRDQDRDGEELSAKYLKDLNWEVETMSILTSINDGIGQNPRSFLEIADWIEKNIEVTD